MINKIYDIVSYHTMRFHSTRRVPILARAHVHLLWSRLPFPQLVGRSLHDDFNIDMYIIHTITCTHIYSLLFTLG